MHDLWCIYRQLAAEIFVLVSESLPPEVELLHAPHPRPVTDLALACRGNAGVVCFLQPLGFGGGLTGRDIATAGGGAGAAFYPYREARRELSCLAAAISAPYALHDTA